MAAKTNLELYTSASKAAQAALNTPTGYQVETDKLAAFNLDANDPADWDQWERFFEQELLNMRSYQKQDAPNVAAAKKAALTAAAKPAAS